MAAVHVLIWRPRPIEAYRLPSFPNAKLGNAMPIYGRTVRQAYLRRQRDLIRYGISSHKGILVSRYCTFGIWRIATLSGRATMDSITLLDHVPMHAGSASLWPERGP
ncbi:hypothetical protein WR25_08740 [Diploscapter pachys]|uniref:Uncharacterized protein n=1 Tax=Diploscapter pachys TaxID=2018661 RepID=A0A2A2K4R9_9BILA|nr:hypothetical protein WR25_08740 [Diploscapter pachys]